MSMFQLLGTVASGLAAYLMKATKDEISSLRGDLRDERDARGNIETKLAAHVAMCAERHSKE